MKSPHKQNGKEKKYYINISSLKNNLSKDINKGSIINSKSLNINNKENYILTSENKKIQNKETQTTDKNKKYYIEKNNKKENEEEEEEINSDEYVSSTNLDVDTLTYINSTNNQNLNDEKKNLKNIEIEKKVINYPGRLRNKLLNNNSDRKTKEIPKDDNNILLNNNKEITNNNLNTFNNINTSNDSNQKNIKKMNNKSDFINSSKSNTKDNNSNSLDKRFIFTPNNEGKKKVKVLKEMIFKKLEDNLKKNRLKNKQQSYTINTLENNNINNLKLNNNQIIKNYIKLNLNLNKEKINKIANSNSITHNSIDGKNMSINELQQNKTSNNIIDIEIYKKNIIKDFGAISINDQKYHLVPKSIKKAKTQGRVGKIVYNKKNNRNNFLYIYNNNHNTINKTINSPLTLNHNKKINNISPLNNNSHNFYSICANKLNNFHSLKNLKIDNVQKSLKKYLLEEEYKKIFPMSKEKVNEIEKEQIKILKDSKNKKFLKNQNTKSKNNNINLNNNKIRKLIKNDKSDLMPLNNNTKSQLRSFNSCYPKRINQNILKNYTTEQILSTISNNHNNNQNSEIFIKKNYVNLTKSKYRNTSDKKYNDEKNSNKKEEVSYNILPQYCKKNILSFKKIKSFKNKILSSDFTNIDNINNKNIQFNKDKKNKPLTTRTKLDLMNDENKNNKKFNTRNNMANNNNSETLNSVNSNINNNYPNSKRIYYENINTLKDINFKTLPYKCLSPNLHNVKQIVEKKQPSKIREMYNKINHNNKGRNSYNMFLSSSMMENNNKHFNNNSNSNFLQINNNNSNPNNIIFLKKFQKDNLKDRYSNISNTVNYNIENIPNFPTQNKKIIVFNNVNNYNINNTNNTLNNITNIKNNQNSNQKNFHKSEDLKNIFSIIDKSYKNPKKIYIKESSNHKNINYNQNNPQNKKQNSDIIEQNIIYINNSNNKNNKLFFEINKNKHQLNKNMIYKLNKNNIATENNTQYDNNSNKIHNNKIINYSVSNNKERERNTINNSYANIYFLKENKTGINRNKNNTIEIFEEINNLTKKSISSIQELKNKF